LLLPILTFVIPLLEPPLMKGNSAITKWPASKEVTSKPLGVKDNYLELELTFLPGLDWIAK
jgi:hypothetical protein